MARAAIKDSNGIYLLIVFCCLLWLLLYPDLAWSKYRFNSWNTDNGLPQNTVYAILQTRDGYLWFTTLDGLVRYDGVRFTIFDKGNTPGLATNRFLSLLEDRRGDLWIGSEESILVHYHDGVFTSYSLEARGEVIMGLQEDNEGNIWVFSSTRISKFHHGQFITYPLKRDLNSSRLNRFGYWYTDSTTLYRFVHGDFVTYPLANFSSTKIVFVNEDQYGNLWIGTEDAGLYKVRNGKTTGYRTDPEYPIDSINLWAVEDKRGVIWLPKRDLLANIRNNRLTSYELKSGLLDSIVATVYEDREGTIWIGTVVGGLYRAREEQITVYSQRDGLMSNNVYPIYQDRDGGIWIATWNTGLSRFKDGLFTGYTPAHGLPTNSVSALFQDRDGYLWIGCSNENITRFKDGRFSLPANVKGAFPNGVSVIYQDRAGAIWFGTSTGLYRYYRDEITSYTVNQGLPDNNVKAICEDREGALWIGTYGGVAHFKNGHFIAYKEEQGLSSGHVRSLYLDQEGTLWIGTYDGGLNRFKNGRFTRYTSREGMSNNGVFQILEDRKGFFWISSNRGIYRVKKQELNAYAEGKISSITPTLYNKDDGLLNIECNGGLQPAGIRTSDGKLWFPTQEGVAVIDPDAVPINDQPPPVVIEECLLEHRLLDTHKQLIVEPGKENLEIHYTGLSFIKPEQVRFKYKLDGLDDEWQEAGTRRTAYYSYLPPGDYVFRVIAANSDGVWNTQGAFVRIVVLPPFWQTWWFALLMLGTIIGLAAIGYKRRIAQLQRAHALQAAFSRQLIESQEHERKRFAAELHDSLGQNLLVIKNRALLALNMPELQTTKEQLDEISAVSSQALEEVREIAYNLRPYQIDRLGLTEALKTMLKKVADSTAIALFVEIDEIDKLFSKESEINFFRIVQECINNIIKHSQADRAKVLIKRDKGRLSLMVEDNGKGFVPVPLAATNAAKGGFGLMGIAERAKMLGGGYEIRSTPGKGTTILVTIDFKDHNNEQRDQNFDRG